MRRVKAEVQAAYKNAEKQPRPAVSEMFTDVYGGEEPWNLVRGSPFFPCLFLSGRARLTMRCGRDLQKAQREELKKLVKKYGRAWEPWKAELQKFKGEGKEWLD